MKTKLSVLALAIGTVLPAAYAATTEDTTTNKNQPETMVVQGVDGSDFKAAAKIWCPLTSTGKLPMAAA